MSRPSRATGRSDVALRADHDRGAGLVEYALLAGLFVLAIMGGLQYIEREGAQRADESARGLTVDGGTVAGSPGAPTPDPPTPPESPDPKPEVPDPEPDPEPEAPDPEPEVPDPESDRPDLPDPGGQLPVWADMTFVPAARWTQQGQWWSAWNAEFRVSYRWDKHADATIEITRIAADGTRYISHQAFYTGNQTIVVRSGFGPDTLAHDKIVAVEIKVLQVKAYDKDWEPLVKDDPGIEATTAIPG